MDEQNQATAAITIRPCNAADIDNSRVIWAREMDAQNNAELLRYFKDRTAWLVEPEANPSKLSPYSAN